MLRRIPTSARSLLRSTLVLSVSNGVLKASNATLFVLVVHTFGREAAGQYSTATTLVAVALGLAQFGLDEILIRERPRHPDMPRLFVVFLLARVGLTAVSIFILNVGLLAIQPYSPTQILLVVVLSFSALGDSVLLLGQALFMAYERPGLVFVTASATSLARIILGLVAVWLWPASLLHLVSTFVVTSLGGGLLALSLSRQTILSRPLVSLATSVRPGEVRAWIGRSRTFFWITLFVLIEFQADIILLSVLRTASDVALYNAALTVVLAVWIIPVALRTVTYPRLARAFVRSAGSFWRLLRKIELLSLAAGLAVAGAVMLFAPLIIALLYPPDYAPSVALLRIMALPLLFAFISGPASRSLLTLHQEKLAMQLVAVTATVNVGANLVLIPRLGPIGAAIARASSAGLFSMLCLGALLVLWLSKTQPAQDEFTLESGQ